MAKTNIILGKIHSQYKFICHALLGEQSGAGIRVVARCLWDPETDGIASAYFENVSEMLLTC